MTRSTKVGALRILATISVATIALVGCGNDEPVSSSDTDIPEEDTVIIT